MKELDVINKKEVIFFELMSLSIICLFSLKNQAHSIDCVSKSMLRLNIVWFERIERYHTCFEGYCGLQCWVSVGCTYYYCVEFKTNEIIEMICARLSQV